jgi:hypothetical protein
LSDLNKQHEIVKMLSVSLSKTHGLAVKAAKAAGTALGPTTMVEARYSHRQAPLPVPVSVKTFFVSSNKKTLNL